MQILATARTIPVLSEGNVLLNHRAVVPLGAMLGQHSPALSVGVQQAISPLLAPDMAGGHIEVGNGVLHSLSVAWPGRHHHGLVEE